MTGNHNTKVDTCGYLFSGMILQTRGDVADVISILFNVSVSRGSFGNICVLCSKKKKILALQWRHTLLEKKKLSC